MSQGCDAVGVPHHARQVEGDRNRQRKRGGDATAAGVEEWRNGNKHVDLCGPFTEHENVHPHSIFPTQRRRKQKRKTTRLKYNPEVGSNREHALSGKKAVFVQARLQQRPHSKTNIVV